VDLWATDAPASNLNGTAYEEFLFLNEVTRVLNEHDPSDPLFLFYAPHIVHCPLQVPQDQLEKY
jgi:hypothetical protein